VLHYPGVTQEISRFLEQNPELLRQFAETFIARWDTYPYQLPAGSYNRAHTNKRDGTIAYHFLTVGHLERHLVGYHTIGAYMLNTESQTRRIVFDDDSEDGIGRLLDLAQDFGRHGIPPSLSSPVAAATCGYTLPHSQAATPGGSGYISSKNGA